jgi:hypothetical protein
MAASCPSESDENEMSDTTTNTTGSDDDRRQFFRIDDTVKLGIRPIDQSELEARVADLEQGAVRSFSVMSSLEAVTAQMAVNLRRIESRDPDLAAYLRGVDQKIEILGRAFLTEESDLVSDQARPVNLSAGGLSLDARGAMPIGQGVEIRMLLFPSFTGLLSYGEVVGCEALPSGASDQYTHQLRLEFVHLREQDRELLIRHVLRRQGEALRARREQVERGKDSAGD